ncbi:hypothetical protein F4778DRAFT_381066 [Xylariomycetidae sp. FL2044]|nr:hypothetical protein F4778DRAFT_381066 [Xylariomycetidae sp. FL2044]
MALTNGLGLAAAGSVLGSAWASGGITALSVSAIPAILASDAPTGGLIRYTQSNRTAL